MNDDKYITKLAKLISPDYPDIDNASNYTKLYAIESGYLGIQKANEDLHQLIKILAEKYSISQDEIITISNKILSESLTPIPALFRCSLV